VDILDIFHLWFLGFWRLNSAQKTSEIFIFSRFCTLLYHFCAFLHFFERQKIVETKFNKAKITLMGLFLCGVRRAAGSEKRVEFGLELLKFFNH